MGQSHSEHKEFGEEPGGGWLQGPWSQGEALDVEKDPEHFCPWGVRHLVVVTPRQLARGVDLL